MKRVLLQSTAFVRAAKRVLKKQPDLTDAVRIAVELLAEDTFAAQLKTHKLRGDLDGSWACSVGYDVRIIFSFVKHEGKEAILLQSIGSHDQVY